MHPSAGIDVLGNPSVLHIVLWTHWGVPGAGSTPWQVDKAAAEKYKVDVDARGLVVLGDR